MSADRIPALLEPIQNRVDEAEAKRGRSRANPDPIWDASMILAIQASSADVPKLLAAVQAVTALHEPGTGYFTTDVACQTCSNSIGFVLYPCATVAAVLAALDG